MNNLHRELAPISDAAWAEIEEEATRTLKRHLGARRVVDVVGPKGLDFSAVGTGHVTQITTPADGIESVQREVKALVELGVPFRLSSRGLRARIESPAPTRSQHNDEVLENLGLSAADRVRLREQEVIGERPLGA